jgi:methylglutaconyl-CoA hydratase
MNKVTTVIEQRGIARVCINNPIKHNAFDDQIIQELMDAFSAIANNPDIKVMVLSSAGLNFSAGADLDWMKRMAEYSFDENLLDSRKLAEMLKTLNFLPQITIAQVQGAVMGGGVGLVSCCDIVIANPEALFCLSEAKLGLVPATISPYVVAAIGARAARRYFITAEQFNVQTACQLGLVSEIAEDLAGKVEAIISKLLTNSPAAIRAAKQLVFDVDGKVIDQQLTDYTCEIIASIRISKEGQEGLSAFLEKRKPLWTLKE